jgi:hypothetical protein
MTFNKISNFFLIIMNKKIDQYFYVMLVLFHILKAYNEQPSA